MVILRLVDIAESWFLDALLSVTMIRQARRRVIDGSVMTALAQGDSESRSKRKLSFIGFPSKGDVAFVVHKPLGEFPARRS